MKRPPRHPPSKASPLQSLNLRKQLNLQSNESNKNNNSNKKNQGTTGKRLSLSSPGSKFLPSILPDDDDEPYSTEKALEEAQAVMSSQGYTSGQLSNFNLLEVVINPRGVASLPPLKPSKILSTSSHGTSSTSTSTANTGSIDSKKKSSNHDVTIPKDLESIAGTLNNMTNMLDTFSRDYFGTSPMDPQSSAMEEYEGWYYDSENTSNNLSAAALQELLGTDPLPEHLHNVDLQGLEDWLNHCCGLAFKFVARGQEAEGVVMDNFDEEEADDEEMQINENSKTAAESDKNVDDDTDINDDLKAEEELTSNEDETGTEEEEEDDYLGIPPIFFSPYFDLTNPQTFEDLLLPNDTSLIPTSPTNNSQSNNGSNGKTLLSTSESMLQKQETLTTYLDNIEISLLHQVRIKSHQFFRETDNFNFLKKLISESVNEVKELRSTLSKLRQNAVLDVEQIPKMAQQRTALMQISALLEKVDNVIQAKASVSGLMAAEDYLGVVEAFNSARSLLDHHHLSRISALAQVKDQFQSYETIVVENMSTALVERFLSWSSMGEDEGEEKKMMDTSSNSTTSTSKLAQVKVILQALEKLKKMHIAQDLYEVRLADMVKVTVKTTVTECAADALTINNDSKDSTVNITNSHGEKVNVTDCVKNMTFSHFLNCLDMLFEQLLGVLRGAVKVDTFLKEEGIPLQQTQKQKNQSQSSISSEQKTMINSSAALSGATELAHKSISDLLRARKEAHSLVSFEEMKNLWDTCLSFTSQLEKCTHGSKAYMLRQTLLAQARSFLERKHESCMAGLAAALDREKWVQCDVSSERQAALTRLWSGRAAYSTNHPKSSSSNVLKPTQQTSNNQQSQHLNEAYIGDTPYKMVWSCLLLLEYLFVNVSSAAHFQPLATSCVSKISELLRLFNSRTKQLVLGAGAIHSAARLKSINAKHLALVTQCLGLVLSILPHIRAALMAQLPNKQYTLLNDLDMIKREYNEHLERVLSKFVSIISGIVEHGLGSRISKTNFDERAKLNNDGVVDCCAFLEGVATNTRKMHQVLVVLLPPDHLRDVFSRIFSNIDSIVPTLFMNADTASSKEKKPAAPSKILGRGNLDKQNNAGFSLPVTEPGKRRMIAEVEIMTKGLNSLPGVNKWQFSAMSVLRTKLELDLNQENEGERDINETEQNGNSTLKGADNKSQTKEQPQDTRAKKEEKENNTDVNNKNGKRSTDEERTHENQNTKNDYIDVGKETRLLSGAEGEKNGQEIGEDKREMEESTERKLQHVENGSESK